MSQPIPYYVVDAFTDRVFSGNPAAVCLMPEVVETTVLQAIAAENNLSETVFVWPKSEAHYDIRWFTPTHEVDLCGHATLAAAFILFPRHAASAKVIHFDSTAHGCLTVSQQHNTYWMEFPQWPLTPISPESKELTALFTQQPLVVLQGTDWVAHLPNEAAVQQFQPQLSLIKALPTRGLVITAQADANQAYDFVSRFFCPQIGIDEDPVTGSTHCQLVPYWAKKLNRSRLKAIQLSKRGGQIEAELTSDRVRLGGQACLYSQGFIHL